MKAHTPSLFPSLFISVALYALNFTRISYHTLERDKRIPSKLAKKYAKNPRDCVSFNREYTGKRAEAGWLNVS
jgi:hypothetical protein